MNYKTVIVPVVAVLALGYGAITGHSINQSTQDEIATVGAVVVGAVVSILGILHNHKTEVKK